MLLPPLQTHTHEHIFSPVGKPHLACVWGGALLVANGNTILRCANEDDGRDFVRCTNGMSFLGTQHYIPNECNAANGENETKFNSLNSSANRAREGDRERPASSS